MTVSSSHLNLILLTLLPYSTPFLIRTPSWLELHHFVLFRSKKVFFGEKWAKFKHNARLKLLYFNKTPVFYWRGYVNKNADWNFSKDYQFLVSTCLCRGGGTWWQGMAAAIPIFEISTTIGNSLSYQYFRDSLGPAIPIF